MTTERLAELEVLHAAATPGAAIEYDNDTGPNDEGFAEWWNACGGKFYSEADAKAAFALHNAFPALLALAREAMARREGATAYQAICAELAKDGWEANLYYSIYHGKFCAEIRQRGPKGGYAQSLAEHETEVAAVQAAIAERDRVKA